MNIDWLSGAAGVVAGTILGFLLSLGATVWQEGRKKQELKHTVSTLLRLEIDQNLVLLGKFWDEVMQVDKIAQEFDSEVLPRACYRLIELPVPHWSHEIWESQLPLLTVALSDEEIRQAHEFHRKLYTLAENQTLLVATQAEKRKVGYQDTGQRGTGKGPTNKKYDLQMLGPWEDCQQIADDLLTRGNPLTMSTSAKTKLLARFSHRNSRASQQEQQV